jgi:Amiloride-sensitive sodium channel
LVKDSFNLKRFLQRKKKLSALKMFCTDLALYGFNENDTCNECLDTLREIRIPPEEMFVECKFQNKVVNCTTAFSEKVFDYSICYTFNGLENYRIDMKNKDELLPQTWNIDDGYSPTAPVHTYPHRALGASKEFGLSVLLKTNKRDMDYACLHEPGFWVNISLSNFLF